MVSTEDSEASWFILFLCFCFCGGEVCFYSRLSLSCGGGFFGVFFVLFPVSLLISGFNEAFSSRAELPHKTPAGGDVHTRLPDVSERNTFQQPRSGASSMFFCTRFHAFHWLFGVLSAGGVGLCARSSPYSALILLVNNIPPYDVMPVILDVLFGVSLL